MILKVETTSHCQTVRSSFSKIILFPKMGKFHLTLGVLLAVTSSTFAQGYRQQSTLYNRGRDSSSLSCRGACPCPQEYIPFCATDGRQETTYSNKCEFECARRCNLNLRIRFEGVCAKPYVRDDGKLPVWDSSSSGSKNSPYVVVPPHTTRRPQLTTRPPYSTGYQPRPTTRPPYSTGYQPRPTTRPPYSTGYQSTTRPPYSTGYQSTTRPPYSTGYQSTTRSPYSTGYQSTTRPPYSTGYQSFTTTAKPWWESDVVGTRYPPDSSSNSVPDVDWRKSRDIGNDNYQLYEEDDYDGEK